MLLLLFHVLQQEEQQLPFLLCVVQSALRIFRVDGAVMSAHTPPWET
jgi:hypothetical protein